jgi:Co/Zn/Cd efflux system component
MSVQCCEHTGQAQLRDMPYRHVLWTLLGINALMFLIEVVAGVVSGSASLQADALDFLADAANYGVSLFVVGMEIRYRARAALTKGITMGLVRNMGAWHVFLACGARDSSAGGHDGSGWDWSAFGKRRLVRASLGVPQR